KAAAEGAPTPAGAATSSQPESGRVMPAARRALASEGLEASDVEATGPGGRLLKEDVLRQASAAPPAPAPSASAPAPAPKGRDARLEETVPMTLLRRKIAENLVSAQQNAALLTTFNEIDMSGVMALRKQYREAFKERYDVKLGFMSFFVKASIDALRNCPEINAEIRGQEIVYRNYFDVGIAVGGGRGLVVPIIRDADAMSFSEIETTIGDFGRRAAGGNITPEELQGGTFTITNGGVYGSLLSTPIVNPPQSGILGLHKIEERPVAVNGEVVIRPMMYVALTYDHRIVDGREAVGFLVRIKETIESPARLLLEV
ncbi:MAG: 2-oxoglutarate dehydrogenase complex dihydrolipoyllysine-residue succinyltransferase, partial [Planctomycetota bacterium]